MNGYLLLTRSRTLLSRLIRFITGQEFTHASIVYHHEIYSITRLDRRFLLPAGFAREYCEFGDGIPYKLYSTPLALPPTVAVGVKYGIRRLLFGRATYHYMVCTDFAYLCITGELPTSKILPIDLTTLPGVSYLGRGTFKEFGAGERFADDAKLM